MWSRAHGWAEEASWDGIALALERWRPRCGIECACNDALVHFMAIALADRARTLSPLQVTSP